MAGEVLEGWALRLQVTADSAYQGPSRCVHMNYRQHLVDAQDIGPIPGG